MTQARGPSSNGPADRGVRAIRLETAKARSVPLRTRNPFRRFNSSPKVIRLVVLMHVRYPLSLRQVERLLSERGVDICHEAVRFWQFRFGPMFAAEIRRRRVRSKSYSLWRWHVDEVFVRINAARHYLWSAVDHEGEVLEAYASKSRDRKAALAFLRRAMKRSLPPEQHPYPLTQRLFEIGLTAPPFGSPGRKSGLTP